MLTMWSAIKMQWRQLRMMRIVYCIGLSMVIVVGILFMLPEPQYIDGFKTIIQLEKYAYQVNEFVVPDTNDFIIPSYDSFFYKSLSKTLFKKIYNKLYGAVYFLGLTSSPLFSESFFLALLTEVVNMREPYTKMNNFVQKIQADAKTQFIIFGAVQGAFHSLVRDLRKIQELNLISETLEIIDSNCFVIFLGNALNRSHLTLETCAILLRLLKKNPHNVIYLRGTNEISPLLRNTTLRRELEMRFPHGDFSAYVKEQVELLCKSFPLNLYTVFPLAEKDKNYFIRFSPTLENNNLQALVSNQNRIKNFLLEEASTQFSSCSLEGGLLSQSEENVANLQELVLLANITDIKKRDSYEANKGLIFSSLIDGVATWTPLSCPTPLYQKAVSFFYDAFCIIKLGSHLKDLQIDLFHRDVRKSTSKFDYKSYNLLTGEIMKKN